MTSTLIYYSAALFLALVFAIYRGHGVSVGIRIEPKNRRKR
jgi:hypothetical protein